MRSHLKVTNLPLVYYCDSLDVILKRLRPGAVFRSASGLSCSVLYAGMYMYDVLSVNFDVFLA